jgi:hypothetical protein
VIFWKEAHQSQTRATPQAHQRHILSGFRMVADFARRYSAFSENKRRLQSDRFVITNKLVREGELIRE